MYRGHYCPSDKATDWDPVFSLEYFLLISVPEFTSPAILTLEYMYPWGYMKTFCGVCIVLRLSVSRFSTSYMDLSLKFTRLRPPFQVHPSYHFPFPSHPAFHEGTSLTQHQSWTLVHCSEYKPQGAVSKGIVRNWYVGTVLQWRHSCVAASYHHTLVPV